MTQHEIDDRPLTVGEWLEGRYAAAVAAGDEVAMQRVEREMRAVREHDTRQA